MTAPPLVPRRELGRTGIEVSALGLGTVKLGRTQALKYPEPFQLPTERAISNLLARASDLGVNLLDTAPAYGTSESRLGPLLAPRRHSWVLCTKAGEELESGRSRFDFSARGIERSVIRSLARLCTDVLDIVLVHSSGVDESRRGLEEAFATLASLRQKGIIRAFGISHKTLAGGLLAAETCDVVMTELNSQDCSMLPVIRRAREAACGVLVKKPLASGTLASSTTALRASLAFAATEPGVSSVVLGTLVPEHLEEAARAIADARAADTRVADKVGRVPNDSR